MSKVWLIVSSKSSSKICLYKCQSILPSMLYNHPTPAYVIELQSMTLPPPPFTVIFTCLGFKLSPSQIQTQLLPSELNRLILVLSDQITLFQSSEVQCFRTLHQSKRFLMLALDSIGFLDLIIAPNPSYEAFFEQFLGLLQFRH